MIYNIVLDQIADILLQYSISIAQTALKKRSERMNTTRKMSLALALLCATLAITVMTLGLVLVSGTQDVITDLDIHYAGGGSLLK